MAFFNVLVSIICMFSTYYNCIALSPNTSEEIVIATGEYEPYTGKKIYKNGFVLDIVREAFKREGYKVVYKFYSWSRVTEELHAKKVDASAYHYYSAEREKKSYFSDQITTEETVFFYNKKRKIKNWEELLDLKNYKIGGTLGYTYTDQFWELSKLKYLNVDITHSDVAGFKKLINGRIDLFPCAKFRAQYILHNLIPSNNSKNVASLDRALTASNGHLLFSKKNKKSKILLKKFNKGLSEMKKDLTYEKMVKDLKSGLYSKST